MIHVNCFRMKPEEVFSEILFKINGESSNLLHLDKQAVLQRIKQSLQLENMYAVCTCMRARERVLIV
jgi:hypothetical protein